LLFQLYHLRFQFLHIHYYEWLRLCSVIFVLYVMSIVTKTCTESQNCSQGSGIAVLSVFIVPTICNNAAFPEWLGFLYVQKVLTQWYRFSNTALWPLNEKDNLYMKTQSQLCGVSSLLLYEHIFYTHHHLLVNLIPLQLLLMLCSYGHYSSGGIEWFVSVAWRRRRMHRKFDSWYESIPE
jgi:hypothetical protein